MKITNHTPSYVNYNTKFDEPEREDQSTVEIKHNNEYESETDRRMKLMEEKYSKIHHEENMRYADPEKHIYDKYRSQYSKEFRHDLSKEERESALQAEMNMLHYGRVGYYNTYDSLFRGSDPINGDVANHQEKAFQRDQVNHQIQDLFARNNITIPNDENLTFSINPNDFQVAVTGSKNIQLMQQIEQVLNDKTNGKELFLHVFQSSDLNSEQMTLEARRKYGLISTLRSGTGYNLRDLESKDGKFLTPDGQDVFDLYLNRMRLNPYERNYVGITASVYGPRYHELAENGFDAMPDLILSINYSNNKLQDIGQKENYSDLHWLADLEKSVKAENEKE
ncbi:DUF4885 family protein [Bacillus sp. NPDC094106]|uniref:DUF4885 family protein n=1 Tax=Bacillus sp. NPDC094106 TaxID=3363949 RepID=UPI00382BBE84